MGRRLWQKRTDPALVEQKSVLTIELPRTHPRVVQGIHVVTEWWMANDDQSVIVCRSAPEECTADELAEVAHYVPGYMTKGGSGSSEYAAIFRTMLKTADSDTSIKTLVRRLLIRITGKDFPRQQVHVFAAHSLPLPVKPVRAPQRTLRCARHIHVGQRVVCWRYAFKTTLPRG